MRDIKRRSNCPISVGLDMIGDKWSLLVVRDLMFKGKSSYGAFLKSEEGIATNILANRLDMLERAGIIGKTPNAEDRRKDVYSLTTKGIDLLPVLAELAVWSAKYDPFTGAPEEFISAMQHNKEGFLREMRDRLERTS